MKIIDIMELNANKYPNKLALVIDENEKTFLELQRESNSLGNAFLKMGIRPKDKVATLFYNETDLIITYFALLKIGVQLVPINFRLAGPEMEYILNHSEATALVYAKEFAKIVGSIKENLNNIKHYFTNSSEGGDEDIHDLLNGDENRPDVKVTSDDYSYLMYTSGTTGLPKGVMINHRNTIWNSLSLSTASETRHEDVVLNPMPLFHGGALNRYQAFLILGTTYISMKNFDAETMLKLIQKHKVSYILMVPAMANMIFKLDNYKQYDLTSVREAIVTAAITPVELKRRVGELFPNAGLMDGYGLTEATSCGACLRPRDTFRKLASVGLPYPFNEAKLVDENDIEITKAGEIGEIIIRGPNVMQGYFKNPASTAETLRGGWLHTGDLGRRDEEGYFYIVDRKKDMIISGGENIYPAEVEATLNSHPKIMESSVIGKKDPKWGETVLALIVMKKGEEITKEEVDKYCQEKMAKYKRPRLIQFISELPRNPSGKVLKTELRKKYGDAIAY